MEKKEKKYISEHVKYHNFFGNLIDYGCKGLDPGLMVLYLMNCMSDKLTTVVNAVRVHSDKYENVFNAVIALLILHIDKRAPMQSVKVTSVGQTRPANWQKTRHPWHFQRKN